MSGQRKSRGTPDDPLDLSGMVLRQVPPHNEAAEQAVLGGVLLRNEALDTLGAELRDRDFYSPAHQAVWQAMLGLWQARQPIDLVSLAQALLAAGELDTVGGPAYLAELSGGAISAANASHHARLVREAAKRRAMIAMGARMIEIAYNPTRDPAEFAEIAGRASEAVLADRIDTSGETPDEFLPAFMEYLEGLEKTGGGGVPTPFPGVNALVSAIMPGEMAVLGGRPSDGKTAMALQFVDHAVREAGKRVGIFSLEMSRNRLLARMFSAETGVAASKFRRGNFGDEDWRRIYAQAEIMSRQHLRIYARRARKISEIRAACRRWKREGGLDLIIIDYAQLVEADVRSQSREQDLAAVSAAIKSLAEDLGIAVLVLAQVNREVLKRNPAKIFISDLRESGAIEQDADIVLLIQPWRHKSTSRAVEIHDATLTVAKARDGDVGDVPLVFNSQTVHFEPDFRRAA